MTSTSIVLDVDTGTDDAGALVWAATAPEIELVAATATWGNCASAQAARNTLVVLEAAGCDAPVYEGCAGASGPAPAGGLEATVLMGRDGLGDVGFADPVGHAEAEPAPEALVRMAREAPGELTLVAVAPLTTVAAALALEPDLPSLLAGITVMGGAVRRGGNITPAAEANIGHDPLAAAAVVNAFGRPGALASGEAPRLVPLDVTTAAPFNEQDLAAFATSPVPGTDLLHRVWSKIWPMGTLESGGKGMPIHDLLALWTVRRPEVCAWELLPLAVDTAGGAAWGATVADQRAATLAGAPLGEDARRAFEQLLGMWPARWRIATTVDSGEFRAGVRKWLAG